MVNGQPALRLGRRCRGDERVERGSRQHLRLGESNVHRHHRRAVELVQVQALDLVVVVYADFVTLNKALVWDSCIEKLEQNGGEGTSNVSVAL